ncbi:MAG: hypothetical protein J0H29_02560 [Sphingobacteriales bacterium]|nr:hypothetical protein [Sphingobacteriales bacterium]OJY85659.1 MAG: hypothetical protein BGP14_00510 [Sphingobacteriales bacterium 44-15]
MEKKIVRPLDFSCTGDLEQIFRPGPVHTKTYFITGREAVGKTSFLLKLARYLEEEFHDAKILYIGHDRRARYWTHIISEKFKENNPDALKAVRFCYLSGGKSIKFLTGHDLLTDRNCDGSSLNIKWDFVLIDGIDYALTRNTFISKWRFKRYYTKRQLQLKTCFFITYKRGKHKHPFINNKHVEYWHLERPEYIEGQTRGNTILYT